jgi:hypothetical protein
MIYDLLLFAPPTPDAIFTDGYILRPPSTRQIPYYDPLVQARLRARYGEMQRSLQRFGVSSKSSPDGYDQGLIRAGRGFGYLSGVEAGGRGNMRATNYFQMRRDRLAQTFSLSERRQRIAGSFGQVAAFDLGITAAWSPSTVNAGQSVTGIAGTTVLYNPQTSVVFTVFITRSDAGSFSAGLPPTTTFTSNCTQSGSWFFGTTYWQATFVANASPEPTDTFLEADWTMTVSGVAGGAPGDGYYIQTLPSSTECPSPSPGSLGFLQINGA